MKDEDDRFVISAEPSTVPVPEGLLGNFIFNTLSQINVNYDAMVDIFTGESISFKSLLEDTCNLAEALRSYGLESGNIVAVCSENSVNFFTPVMASLYLGATVATINPLYSEEELRYSLNLYQPKIVFCSSFTIEQFLYLKEELEFVEKVILMDNNEPPHGNENIKGFVSKHLVGGFVRPRNFKPFKSADPCDHVSFILSSSGTTGLPKGVMLTDRNLLVRVAHSRDPTTHDQNFHGTTVIGLMPFFHGFGLNITLGCLLNQQRIAVFKMFDEDLFLKTLQGYRIADLAIAPALAVFLAKSPKVLKYDLSSIRDVICGAAPMSKELEQTLTKRLNIPVIRQGYGLTEANVAVTLIRRNRYNKPGSSGQILPYLSIKVRDPESGKSLGPNQVGEICIKGPTVMKGYYKNPQATRDTFTDDRWLKTGDLGYYDSDKCFYIVDRLKELIKYKGFQVAPAELEAVLLNHPKVFDVGVVGKPDEVAGELPVAFIVKKPGVEVTEKELTDYIAKKLSPQKRLRGGVVFIDAIPKNLSGKILRRELKKMIPQSRANIESKL